MIPTKFSFRVLAIALFVSSVFPSEHVNAQQPAKNDTTLTYMTASPDVAAKTLATAQEIGKLNGDTYYFISSGVPGIGQIIRVKTTDHTKYMLVGTLNSGKASIANPAEKSAFEQVENNMTIGQARAIGFSGGSDAPQPTTQNAIIKQGQPSAGEGTAAKKGDGSVEVKFQNGELVEFLPGAHMLLLAANGDKIAEVTYTGVTGGQTAGKKVENGLSSAVKVGIAGITRGNKESLDPRNYTIIDYTAPGGPLTYDTTKLGEGKSGGGGGVVGSPTVAKILIAYKVAVDQNCIQMGYLPVPEKLETVAGNRQ
jgi:hypothetical protein